MSYDNACKYLAEQYPAELVRWLLATLPPKVEVLKTELSLEPIRADSVIFLPTTNQILHIEFQTLASSSPPMNLRMLDYSVRLKRQYRCEVVQVVIFLQETTSEAAWTEEYRDSTTTHRYRAVRMWEQDPAIFLANPGLLALAPLARTDAPTVLLGQVAAAVEKIADQGQKANIAGCIDILAGVRFEKDLIRQFIREELVQESVTYQDIVQKTKQQEALKIISLLLPQRFGKIEASLMEKISKLSAEKLETLAVSILSLSESAELNTWLEQNK